MGDIIDHLGRALRAILTPFKKAEQILNRVKIIALNLIKKD